MGASVGLVCHNLVGYYFDSTIFSHHFFFFQIISYILLVGVFTLNGLLDTSRGHRSRPFSPLVSSIASMMSRVGFSILTTPPVFNDFFELCSRCCTCYGIALNYLERPVSIRVQVLETCISWEACLRWGTRRFQGKATSLSLPTFFVT